MANQDFQNRLQKIADRAPSRPQTPDGFDAGPIVSVPAKSGISLHFFLGSFFMSFGMTLLSSANDKYEAAKLSGNLTVTLVMAGVGAIALVVGIVKMARNLPDKAAQRELTEGPATSPSQRRLISTLGAIVGFSLSFCTSYSIQMHNFFERTGLEPNYNSAVLLFLVAIILYFICFGISLANGLRTTLRYHAYVFVGFVLMLILSATWIISPYRVIDALGFVH